MWKAILFIIFPVLAIIIAYTKSGFAIGSLVLSAFIGLLLASIVTRIIENILIRTGKIPAPVAPVINDEDQKN